MRIDDLIALCHILDEFKNFSDEVEKIIKDEHGEDLKLVRDVTNAAKSNKLKLNEHYFFCKRNLNTIKTISKYTNVDEFMRSVYERVSFLSGGMYYVGIPFKIEEIYNYLMRNRENLPHILLLLFRMKKLGIRFLEIDEKYNFNDWIYEIERSFDKCIVYAENIEILPSYDDKVIRYKSNDSSYKLSLSVDVLNREYASIEVSNLLFSVDKLPSSINKKSLVNEILLKEKNSQFQNFNITNLVKVGVNVEDLKQQYQNVFDEIQRLDDWEEQKELIGVLSEINKKLIIFESLYDIRKERLNMNDERIEEEKKVYRRIKKQGRD